MIKTHEDGASALEYILLIAGVAIAAILAIGAFGSGVRGFFQKADTQLAGNGGNTITVGAFKNADGSYTLAWNTDGTFNISASTDGGATFTPITNITARKIALTPSATPVIYKITKNETGDWGTVTLDPSNYPAGDTTFQGAQATVYEGQSTASCTTCHGFEWNGSTGYFLVFGGPVVADPVYTGEYVLNVQGKSWIGYRTTTDSNTSRIQHYTLTPGNTYTMSLMVYFPSAYSGTLKVYPYDNEQNTSSFSDEAEFHASTGIFALIPERVNAPITFDVNTPGGEWVVLTKEFTYNGAATTKGGIVVEANTYPFLFKRAGIY